MLQLDNALDNFKLYMEYGTFLNATFIDNTIILSSVLFSFRILIHFTALLQSVSLETLPYMF